MVVLLFFFLFSNVQAQVEKKIDRDLSYGNPDREKEMQSLVTKILNESKYIFEGVPVSSECYYDPNDSSKVYTTHIIKIEKIFRGKNLKLGTIKMIYKDGFIPKIHKIMPNGEIKNSYVDVSHRGRKAIVYSQSSLFFCTKPDVLQDPNMIEEVDNKTVVMTTEISGESSIRMDDGKQGDDAHHAVGLYLKFKNNEEVYSYLKSKKIEVIKEKPAEIEVSQQ